jgi:hypothetical protein
MNWKACKKEAVVANFGVAKFGAMFAQKRRSLGLYTSLAD